MKKPKSIHAKELSSIRMVGHNEKKRDMTKVIDGNLIKQWVGIGWVTEGVARAEDYKKYPTVKRD